MPVLSLPPAVGTQADFASRLRAVLPAGWFADTAPVLNGVLQGLSSAWSTLYVQLAYTQAQTRIATATDTFLDLVAQDFFGAAFARGANEPDTSFRIRIQRNLLQPAATRGALQAAVFTLTGRAPRIFEPTRLNDTGAYGQAATLAYNRMGGYGSFALPFQCFVIGYRPVGAGVAETNGYGGGIGGYGVGAAQYTTPTMAGSTVLDASITAAVAATLPAATTAWMAISN